MDGHSDRQAESQYNNIDEGRKPKHYYYDLGRQIVPKKIVPEKVVPKQ